MFAFGVAFFTAGHEITLGGLAAPNDRHQMIHGQFIGWESFAAMMANSRPALALPPRAGAQLARLLPLAANLLFGNFDQKSG